MKRILIGLLIIIVVPILIWRASYLYCEYLTKQYGDTILSDIQDDLVYPGNELVCFKVLKYQNGKTAKVYAVDESIEDRLQEGWVHVLTFENGKWKIAENGIYGWSQYGSADDPVWPYALLPG